MSSGVQFADILIALEPTGFSSQDRLSFWGWSQRDSSLRWGVYLQFYKDAC